MRTNTMLVDGLDEVKTFYQFLYMSKDSFIEVTNILNVRLRIHMGEDMEIYCQNMNFPDVPPARWSEEMTLSTVISIIAQLKEMPAIEFPQRFKSRWEEIWTFTKSTVGMNSMNIANYNAKHNKKDYSQNKYSRRE